MFTMFSMIYISTYLAEKSSHKFRQIVLFLTSQKFESAGHDFHKKFWNIENILHWQLSTYFTHSTKIEIHYFHDPSVRYNVFECVDHNIHESFHHH